MYHLARFFKSVLIPLTLLSVVLFFLWSKPSPSMTIKESSVLVSIAPYAFFVHRIGGPEIPVIPLIPEGANPHVYEPRPQDIAKLQNADLWIQLGDLFDQKIERSLKEQNQDLRIVNITQNIPLISSCSSTHDHHLCADEGKDLHIWLSPKLAKIQAETIAAALIDLFPQNESLYTERLQHFLEELDTLDRDIEQQLASKKGEAILVSHPAFAYFCKDYDLTQLSIEIEGKEPCPQDITRLLEQAKNYKVSVVILEPQYSNKGAEMVANALHLPTTMLNPYTENYFENLKHLADVIAAKMNP